MVGVEAVADETMDHHSKASADYGEQSSSVKNQSVE